jgi:hypothetical protein
LVPSNVSGVISGVPPNWLALAGFGRKHLDSMPTILWRAGAGRLDHVCRLKVRVV